MCCITACREIPLISGPHPAICVVLLSVLYYSVSRDPTDQWSPPSHLCSVTQCCYITACYSVCCVTACYSVCCITACYSVCCVQRVTQCVVLQRVTQCVSVLLSVLYYRDQRSPPSHLCSVTQCVVLQRVTQCVVHYSSVLLSVLYSVLLSVLYYSVLLSVLYYSVSRGTQCVPTVCCITACVTQCVVLQRVPTQPSV